jgi:hypothetical protein
VEAQKELTLRFVKREPTVEARDGLEIYPGVVPRLLIICVRPSVET